jgi:hypothetical protein
LIQKEYDQKLKKATATELISHKIIKAYILEKNLRFEQANQDTLSVFEEL